jgi:hypothetical protein
MLAPDWVPKDANLAVTLVMYQLIRSLRTGQQLPKVGKFQVSRTALQVTSFAVSDEIPARRSLGLK